MQNQTVQTFTTGRTYNGPQVLEFIIIAQTFEPDWGDHTSTVIMRDESRGLSYKMEVIGGATVTGSQVLAKYDAGFNSHVSHLEVEAVFNEVVEMDFTAEHAEPDELHETGLLLKEYDENASRFPPITTPRKRAQIKALASHLINTVISYKDHNRFDLEREIAVTPDSFMLNIYQAGFDFGNVEGFKEGRESESGKVDSSIRFFYRAADELAHKGSDKGVEVYRVVNGKPTCYAFDYSLKGASWAGYRTEANIALAEALKIELADPYKVNGFKDSSISMEEF